MNNILIYYLSTIFLGILVDIQRQFKIGDDKGGLLQTAFVISYMICAPVFGYLGDRYNRKYIMAFGVLLWSLTTFVGSYMNVSFIRLNYESLLFFFQIIFTATFVHRNIIYFCSSGVWWVSVKLVTRLLRLQL